MENEYTYPRGQEHSMQFLYEHEYTLCIVGNEHVTSHVWSELQANTLNMK